MQLIYNYSSTAWNTLEMQNPFRHRLNVNYFLLFLRVSLVLVKWGMPEGSKTLDSCEPIGGWKADPPAIEQPIHSIYFTDEYHLLSNATN